MPYLYEGEGFLVSCCADPTPDIIGGPYIANPFVWSALVITAQTLCLDCDLNTQIGGLNTEQER